MMKQRGSDQARVAGRQLSGPAGVKTGKSADGLSVRGLPHCEIIFIGALLWQPPSLFFFQLRGRRGPTGALAQSVGSRSHQATGVATPMCRLSAPRAGQCDGVGRWHQPAPACPAVRPAALCLFGFGCRFFIHINS